MSVYILHFDRPIAHARHYVGYSEDVIGRILEHADTTWEPLAEPIDMPDGRHISGRKHGTGATLIGVANYLSVEWRLARIFEGADQSFERALKNTHSTADYCPFCSKHPRTYHPKGA